MPQSAFLRMADTTPDDLSVLHHAAIVATAASAMAVQSAHWTTQGLEFYSRHLIYGDAYEALADLQDALAENFLGHFPDAADSLRPSRLAPMVVEALDALAPEMGPEAQANAALAAVLEHLAALVASPGASDGLQNICQGAAEELERFQYLLSRQDAKVVSEGAEVAAAGKCPPSGCVKEVDGKWRVVSNKTGKLWPQTYDTKKDAEDALAAYHVHQ